MKWCVKRSELRGRTRFPQYCAGIGYTLSSALLGLLYNASTTTPFFWIDDVYVTGLLAKKLPASVKYVDTGRHFTSKVYYCVLFCLARSTECKYYLRLRPDSLSPNIKSSSIVERDFVIILILKI